MDRRKFLSLIGAGWCASRVPFVATAATNLVTACAIGNKAGIPTRADGFVPITTIGDAIEEINRVGEFVIEESKVGSVSVFRNPDEPETLMAVNPVCQNKGCLIRWKSKRKSFVCPCYGTRYSADGEIIEGPATKPLETYTAKLEGDMVLVKEG